MGWHDLNLDKSLIEDVRSIMESAGTGKFLIHKTDLKKAKEHAMSVLGDQFETVYQDFDNRYNTIKNSIKKFSKGIKRVDMPVIDADQIDDFDNHLKTGKIDIFKPFAKGKFVEPEDLGGMEGEWIELGQHDGNDKDDIVKGRMTKIAADKLKPIQTEIHFDKITGNAKQFGPMKDGSVPTKLTIITSSDGYIIDGHHRWGLAMMTNPKVKLQALVIPLKIDTLLDVARGYGDALGNQRNV